MEDIYSPIRAVVEEQEREREKEREREIGRREHKFQCFDWIHDIYHQRDWIDLSRGSNGFGQISTDDLLWSWLCIIASHISSQISSDVSEMFCNGVAHWSSQGQGWGRQKKKKKKAGESRGGQTWSRCISSSQTFAWSNLRPQVLHGRCLVLTQRYCTTFPSNSDPDLETLQSREEFSWARKNVSGNASPRRKRFGTKEYISNKEYVFMISLYRYFGTSRAIRVNQRVPYHWVDLRPLSAASVALTESAFWK